MSNPFYTATGAPVAVSRGASGSERAEFLNVQTGFDKLPPVQTLYTNNATFGTDTGAVNAFAVAGNVLVTALTDGMEIVFKAANANTGASTVNINALGIKAVTRPDGSPLQANDIVAGQIVELRYVTSSGVFQFLNLSAVGSSASAAASASAASTSATNAANSATNSANSATASAGSAASSSTSATNAANSATSAATSATNASAAAATTVQAGAAVSANTAGSADVITATFTPTVTTLTNGMSLIVRAGFTNLTTTPTFQANATLAKTIVKANNLPLLPGDIAGIGHWLVLTYDAALSKWVLENPAAAPIVGDGTASISFRNRLINGNFAVNQLPVAGTVTLAAGVYGHDGWKAGASCATYTFAASGIDTVITITAGSLIQIIEAKNIEGGIYTLSQTGAAQARIAINGAVTSGAYAAGTLASATATANQSITVEFTTGTISLTQLEAGVIVSRFERLDSGRQLQQCQRYYEQGTSRYDGTATSGVAQSTPVFYKATKYIGPTVIFVNAGNVSFPATPSTTAASTVDGFYALRTASASGGGNFVDNWTASART